jgi:hypothetical protein
VVIQSSESARLMVAIVKDYPGIVLLQTGTPKTFVTYCQPALAQAHAHLASLSFAFTAESGCEAR